MEVELPMDVLVVEDNEGDVRLIREGFEACAIECSLTVVHDGASALDRLVREPGDTLSAPDLLFLDLNVPKKTGRDVLERIWNGPERPTFAIMVLSGSQSAEHIRETYQLGADGYFVKPIDPHEFISLVETVAESVATSGTPPPGELATVD